MADIRESIESAVQYLSAHSDEARYRDTSARATLGEALRVDVSGENGERLRTDMPQAVGGRGEAPSPGWYYRAALASCVASTVAMQAAQEGITLSSLEVVVDSESDDRGILGMDETIPVGPLSTRIVIRAGTDSPGREIDEMIERGAARCPVRDATKRAVEVTTEIELQ